MNPPAPPDTLSLAGCDTSNVTFSKSIQSVLQRSCVGCHSGSPPGGGIDLTSYGGVLAVVNTGRLLGAIQWLPGYFHMPKNGNKLSVCEISLFRIWVDAGALNN